FYVNSLLEVLRFIRFINILFSVRKEHCGQTPFGLNNLKCHIYASENQIFMLSITRSCICIMLVLIVCSCKQEIKPEALYGKWKYIKIQNTLENPMDTVSADEMNAADPS